MSQQQELNNLVRNICRSQPFKLAYNLNSTMYEVQDLQILLKGSCWKHPYNELPYGEQHWVMCTVRNKMRPDAPLISEFQKLTDRICISSVIQERMSTKTSLSDIYEVRKLVTNTIYYGQVMALSNNQQAELRLSIWERLRPSNKSVASMMDRPVTFSQIFIEPAAEIHVLPKTADQVRKDHKDREYALMYGSTRTAQNPIGESMVDSMTGDFGKLEELALASIDFSKINVKGTVTGRFKNTNPCMEIPLPHSMHMCTDFATEQDYSASISAFFDINPTPKKETEMNTSTEHYVNGQNVNELTEGQLIDKSNKCDQFIQDNKDQIEKHKETISKLKEANDTLIADRNVIKGHIADKRSK